MSTANIQKRRSIHTEPITTPNRTTNHESQEELTDCSDSEELLAEQSIPTEDLKERNESDIENHSNKLNDSEKRAVALRTTSPRHQKKDASVPHSSSMTQETEVVFDQPPSSVNRIKIYLILFFIIISIAMSIAISFFWPSNPDPGLKLCSFSKLKAKYPKEGDYLWHHLQFGNENILNKKSDTPAVFLFVHHGGKSAKTLIQDIAQTSTDCFGTSPTIDNIDLTSELVKKDFGHAIEAYKNSIKEGNVILIANLNEIPGEAAKALHSICDTKTPLVKKVIILLSLTVEQKNSEEKVIDVVETALIQLWQDKMERNELDPIITRVTDQVLLLQSN